MGKIIRRYYIEADVELATPLSVSNGMNEHTDTDVLKNAAGDVFLPATSIAGAFRNYLQQEKEKDDGIMGFSDGEKGKMSSLWIEDTYLSGAHVTVRDGVSLLENKTVENKYDYEIVESGAKATICMERIVREETFSKNKNISQKVEMETAKQMDLQQKKELQEVRQLLSAMESGEIRFGYKKNRGLGWLKVQAVRMRCFDAGNVKDWLAWCDMAGQKENTESADATVCLPVWKEWKLTEEESDNAKEKYIKIQVPLRLTGGISIRKYSAQPGEADYEHITVHGKPGEKDERIPVIPGSSWSGAIRSCVRDILYMLKQKYKPATEINKIINAWFGYVDVKGGKEKETGGAQQSMVVFRESQLRNSISMPVTRNHISRFDASSAGLYTERAYFGGETTLEMLVRKQEDDTHKALIEMLLLVIEELQDGFLAIGGQTAIGRGVFERDTNEQGEKKEIICSEDINSKEKRKLCREALADMLYGRKGDAV